MKIKSFEINNYTCFDKISFDLDERLTVFVGANGSGKTSILNAISYYSVFYEKGTKTNFNKTDNIIDKIRLGSDTSEFLLVAEYSILNLVNNSLQVLFGSSEDSIIKVSSRFKKPIKHLGFDVLPKEHENNINNYLDSSLKQPFAYYTSKRVLPDNITIKTSYEQISSDNTYINNTSPKIDFEASMSWFLQKDNEEARIVRDEDKNYRISELQAVRDAISTALGDYISPRMIGSPPEFVIYEKEDKERKKPFKINQLSDGYRTMLALVMDLARRMAVANIDNPIENFSILDSNALVLIDEIELHLHPSWQQKVLPSLLKIFPNAQFVVTTHSPQVISSIEPKHLRILKDNQVISTEANTYGAESIRILDEIFGVPARSPITEAKKNLDKYLELVNDNQYNSKEALNLRESLDIWLGNDPVLETADFMINQKRREASRA